MSDDGWNSFRRSSVYRRMRLRRGDVAWEYLYGYTTLASARSAVIAQGLAWHLFWTFLALFFGLHLVGFLLLFPTKKQSRRSYEKACRDAVARREQGR